MQDNPPAPDTAAPESQSQTPTDSTEPKWYTLKEAARILGKSKSAIEYHAGKLDSTDRKTDDSGIIRISAAAVDAISQKVRASVKHVPSKYQTSTTSTQQVPENRPRMLLGTQQAPEKYPTSTQEAAEQSFSGTQQAPQNRPTSTQQVPNFAEQTALDTLKEIIEGLRTDLQRAENEKRESMKEADQLRADLARAEEREHAAQDRAERAEKELDTLKAQNQTLTEQLAAIADKQADAIRAGAAEQLALAIPEKEKKTGIIAGFVRLFHRKKDEE